MITILVPIGIVAMTLFVEHVIIPKFMAKTWPKLRRKFEALRDKVKALWRKYVRR